MIGSGSVRGAAPAGVEPGDDVAVGRAVRAMFGRVAPRYDLLNHLLSGQIDRYWRRCLVRAVRPVLERPGARLADLCCGTGDLALALERERRRIGSVTGTPCLASDFCRPMLKLATTKAQRAGTSAWFVEADASHMPLADSSFDLIAIAYGFRNLASYQAGAEECARLLADGGCLAILEFSEPESRLWRTAFNLYFHHVLPGLGNAISGSGGAYSYLQASVARFPPPPEVCGLLCASGFRRVEKRSLTGGVSVLYLAYK